MEVEWRCLNCDETRPATVKDFKKFQMHAKGHKIVLVNKETGEVLAESLQAARAKGYFKEVVEVEKEARTEEVTEMLVGEDHETYFPVRAWLPASMFTLFRYARAEKLCDHKDVISFICEYAQVGFMKVHNLSLSLAQIKEGGDSEKAMEELKLTVQTLTEKVDALTKGKE